MFFGVRLWIPGNGVYHVAVRNYGLAHGRCLHYVSMYNDGLSHSDGLHYVGLYHTDLGWSVLCLPVLSCCLWNS
jgi:hypothetical protein